MKTASAIYKMLRVVDTSWYEIRVVQGNNIYGLDRLKSVTMSPILTTGSGVSIGGANSTECRIKLIEESAYWPRMAQFTVEFRICASSGSTKSEWITAGTFYTDERSEDKYGNLSIVAFDGMMKADQSWTDKIPSADLPSTWPITAYDWASMIENANLAEFEDLTQLDDTVEFIGLDTTTSIRDVLKSIAAVHAGNWTMTADEKLRLVQFENVTEPGQGEAKRYSNLELSMVTFDSSPALSAVTGVHLETEAGTVVEAGTDTGYRVKSVCDFSSTTGVADLCLGKINQYVYKPFEAGNAYLDPIVEIGDSVKIDGIIYQIMSVDWKFSKDPVASVSAPYDQEVDHEYTVVSQDAKTYRKTVALVDQKMEDYVPWDEMSTAIEQNAESVVIAASGTYVTQSDYDETIAEIQSQLDGSIQTWSGNVVPTLNNSPAVDWNTPTLKAEHVGDTYFVNSDAGIPEAGNYYRFENNNGVYSWQLLTDSALTEALAQAAAAMAAAENAQDTASDAEGIARQKGRIFVVQPTPPYDVGDLWFNNTESVIKVCMTARESGNYVSTDWVKRDNYTDYNSLDAWLAQNSTTIQAIKNQVDQKAETYYQDTDPMIYWNGATIAGIAIAGINKATFDGDLILSHEGDLWYRTTDNTTWFFDGTRWVQQDVPDEVFDKIDGKAQVFVNTPYTPYAVGDLWFNGTDDDIKTCIRDRASGAYVASDWVKYNKYTDDSAFEEWTTEVYTADLEVTNRAISAKVQKDQSGTKTSFGWVLNETAHTWYSNNQEVMKVNRSGLTVKGNITATSGYIGSDASGFEITATAIRNGMTSLSDTTHNGVYIGTNGIALGAGKFTVTSSGAVTASNLSITGGSIKLGGTTSDPVFSVTSAGAVTAKNLALTGGSISIKNSSNQVMFAVSNAGAITAKSGNIGGFTLNATSLYNGKSSVSADTTSGVFVGTSGIALGNGTANHTFKVTSAGAMTVKYGMNSLSDTTNNGVYIGTDGIALGAGKFIVTNAGVVTAKDLRISGGQIEIRDANNTVAFSVSNRGAVTAKNLTLNGGSININDKFKVDSSGNLTAENGTFAGNVYAKNIKYNDGTYGSSTYGYFDGAGLKSGSVQGSGGSGTGQIKSYTLGDNDVYKYSTGSGYVGAFSSSSFNTDVQGGLYGGTAFNNAVKQSGGTYPSYFQAESIKASRSVTAMNDVYKDYGDGTYLSLTGHYHAISVDADGKVSIGQPQIDEPDPFDIADTKAFKDGVKAVTVKSFGYEQDEEQRTDYSLCYVTLAYNGDTTRTVGNLDNSEALGWAYNYGLGDAVDSFTIARVGVNDYTLIGNAWYIPVKATVYKTGGQTTTNITGTDTKNVNVNDVVNAAKSYGCNGKVTITSTSNDSAYVKIYDPEGTQVFGRWVSYNDDPWSFSN